MATGEMNRAGVADEESPRLKSDSTRRRQCHRERERGESRGRFVQRAIPRRADAIYTVFYDITRLYVYVHG